MSRYNWISRALWTLSVLACGSTLPAPAAADFAPDAALHTTVGDCAVQTGVEHGADGDAYVIIGLPGYGVGAPEGTYYEDGTPVNANFTIDATIIELCLGKPAGTVTAFNSNGADATKITDTEYGFSFTLNYDILPIRLGDVHDFFLTPLAPGPTVALTSNATAVQSGVFTVTATFSEAVTGFEIGDISLNNATASNFSATSATVYTVDVTPTADGAVTVDVAADVAADTATNGNTAATQISVTSDQTAPTVALTSDAAAVQSGVFTVTATFDEAVTGFEIGDISLNNATASNFSATSATVSIDVTPTKDGAVTVDVAADVAEDTATNGNTAATQISVTTDGTKPTVEISGPTEVVTTDFQVTFTFSETVSDFTVHDVTVVNGTKGSFDVSDQTYTLMISPELGKTVSISVEAGKAEDAAGNGNKASDVFEVQAGSPASEFAQNEAEIRQVIVDDATRSLQSTMSANDRMIRDARGRFIDSQRQSSEGEGALSSNNNVAFDIDGSANVNGTTLRTKGTFFGQQGNFEGTQRRLVFGDFDVQHDGDTGSSTATITGRIAWEQMTSNDTMLGYFIGGELAHSNIAGSFEGDQNRLGVTAGGYVVHQLNEQVFLDGFITLGAGRNNLEMANDVLALESDYTTQTATVGAELSGVYEYGQYEFHPELAFSYGQTWIDDVGFTGRAYGLVDNTLSLDAGNVSIANLTLRPEIVWALDAETVADSNSQLSFAPRLICERTIAATTTQDCGAGAEIGLMSQSEDGLSSANIRFVVDRVGNSNRSSVVLNLEQRF
jgi:hypothetical protein